MTHPVHPRPRRLVLVIGTATDIGKTWMGGQTLALLRGAGATVAARKPAQSADPAEPGPSDSEVLAGATGEDPLDVCPAHRSYTVPMAPPMAAAALGLPVPTMADLLAELRWPEPVPDIGWLETVGGPRSPIGADGDAVDLAQAIDPDVVVLVADAGLGTVNAVILSAAPFTDRELVVVLNRFDPANDLHRRNRDWLTTREGLGVVVDPEALARYLHPV
ncbi:dethiobiotin synthase [Aquihabitans sp. G128]|uniref:ATP-dependent dethiobiotin synthetase BioD n=1 Tax=Aquihabitans sp. G128 TaxID=2849779 RepID=UPI001C239CD6|nr:dethiobiotin synthase [Aquihabitans sp. G128]QXC60463.1 dethiobiotin synthase [Aquihabitans sp. G128]